MTSLKGDLRSIMGTPFGGVGHAVLIFSRVTRAAFNSDSVVLQLHDRIEMPEEADGKFQVDGLDPGPIRIELEGGTVHNHGWNIDLPDEGVWSLTDLVDAQVDWSPAVIGRAEAAAREARDHADRAEAGADRVGTAEQVGAWASEASASASSAASARSAAQTARNASQSARDAAEGHADRAATSESNAKTSETNAKQSEDNAGDYAAVATTAATEAVDAMERATDLAGGDFATHEYVDAIGQDVQRIAKTVEPIGVYRDDSFAVIDSLSRVAFKVDADGNTLVGATSFVESTPGFRVLDSEDRIAFEITSDGKTIINDLAGTEGDDPTAVTELHAFICAGQSNMSGRGDPVDDVLDVENPRLLQFGHNRRVIEPAPALLDMMDSPLGLSPARQFGLRYLQTQPANVAVLLIPAAHGGTGFTYNPTPGKKTWTKGHADTEENGLYERALAHSQDALTAAQQAGYAVELKGLLWHQGEANGSSLPQNMQAYSERLDALIADFRTDLNVPNLPVIVGEMLPEGMRESIAKRSIGYVHAQTPERVQRVAFAPAPDNAMRHDDLAHFSREGAILLGDSFFDAWPRAVLNVPTGKPRAARDVATYRVGDQVTVSWSAPMSRVTKYVVEWASTPDGSWQEVTREWPMNLSETFTAHDAPVWVRVTAYEDSTPATPTNPIPALGA